MHSRRRNSQSEDGSHLARGPKKNLQQGLDTPRPSLYNSHPMLVTQPFTEAPSRELQAVEDELRECKQTLEALQRALVEERCQSHYWRAQHGRCRAREEALKEKVRELEAKLDEYEQRHRKDQRLIAALRRKLKQFARMLFAPGSEKRKEKEKEDTAPAPPQEGGEEKAPSEPKKRRGKQPGAKGYGRWRREELPTETVYHPLGEEERRCPGCGKPVVVLPETEDSEEIDIRVEVVRIVHKREKAKPTCSCGLLPGIVTAPVPPKVIPKGLFTVGFWTYVMVEKFLLGRPLSRVILQLALWGLVDPRTGKPGVSQGTLTEGLKRIWDLIRPLYERIVGEVPKANHWHMDETRWLVFVETEGKQGYRWWLWVAVTREAVCYVLDPSRSSRVAKRLLAGARGTLSVDRYSAYKSLAAEEEGIRLSFCWAHVRRDFDRAERCAEDPRLREWARNWLDRIAQLYHLNTERLQVRERPEVFRERDQALRAAVRSFREEVDRERSQPGLDEIQEKILASVVEHWEGLTVFVDVPEIPIDNSEAERQLREVALGRKNYYGSGSVWSGHMTAGVLTVLRTARRNGLNPRHWLEVYLEDCARNRGRPPEDLEAYLPWKLSERVREAIRAKVRRKEIPP